MPGRSKSPSVVSCAAACYGPTRLSRTPSALRAPLLPAELPFFFHSPDSGSFLIVHFGGAAEPTTKSTAVVGSTGAALPPATCGVLHLLHLDVEP